MAEEQEGGKGLLHKKLFGLPAPVVLGAGALLIWFVLSHRRAAGGGVAPSAAGAPDLSGGGGGAGTAMSLQDQLQAEQLGFRTAMDQLNLEAARTGLSQAELPFQQQQAALSNFGSPSSPVVSGSQGGHTTYSYGQGATSKAWQQVTIGGQQMWEDIFHPGHIITEQQAQQFAPQDRGPYAKGSGGFLGQVWSNIKQALQIYANSQGVPISLGGGQTRFTLANPQFPVGPAPQRQPASPNVAPSTAPATPYYTPPFVSAGKNTLLA